MGNKVDCEECEDYDSVVSNTQGISALELKIYLSKNKRVIEYSGELVVRRYESGKCIVREVSNSSEVTYEGWDLTHNSNSLLDYNTSLAIYDSRGYGRSYSLSTLRRDFMYFYTTLKSFVCQRAFLKMYKSDMGYDDIFVHPGEVGDEYVTRYSNDVKRMLKDIQVELHDKDACIHELLV